MNDMRARSSVAFDWSMASLAAVLIGGVLLDGWAHSHGEVDQSFLTPWHAVLYGAMALNGIVLAVAALRGLRRTSGRLLELTTWRNALPPGYWGAAFGVVLFLFAGAFDGLWHTLFGIETGISLLISPSHLLLALAMGMIASGPLCSVASQYGPESGGWRRIGPAVIATWVLLTLVGFFLAYAQPIEDGFTTVTIQPAPGDVVYPQLFVAGAGNVARVALSPHTLLAAVSVAPDGSRLVYRVNRYSDPSGEPPSDLYVAGAGGGHAVRITNSSRHDTLPQWSPDGRWIAYLSMPAGTSGDFSIRLVKPDGSGNHAVFQTPTTIDSLAWSPDSTSIAIASRRGTSPAIGLIDVPTGAFRWLPFTLGGGAPAWHGRRLAFVGPDGAVREADLDGSNLRTLPPSAVDSVVWSGDGRRLAYVARDGADAQVFVADADGTHPRNVSQLSGLNVTSVAWAPDGRVFFTAAARRDPTHTELGFSLAQAALLLQAVAVAGALLPLVRRWPLPAGACTVVLTAFALAMAVESDYYYYALPALATGVAADLGIRLGGERIRSGPGFYSFGFALPAVFNAFYLVTTVRAGGGSSAWPWNLLLGAPLLAGAIGAFVAFCLGASPAGTGARIGGEA